jgi:hypothetical protein
MKMIDAPDCTQYAWALNSVMCITGALKTLKPLSDKGQKLNPEDVALFSGYKPQLVVRLIDWALR